MALNSYGNKNKLYRTLDYLTRIHSILIFQKTVLDYLTRDTLNLNFSENGLRLVSPSQFVYDIFVFSSRFATWTKSQDKNLNILRMKRAFEVK